MECADCKVQLIINDNGLPMVFNWFIDTTTGTQLQWNFQDKTCSYNVGSKKSDKFDIWVIFTSTNLPWLPLNISLDRVKTLILFS